MLPVLLFASVSGLTAAALNVIGASLYDLAQLKTQKQKRLHPHAKQFRARPTVYVIIYTHNSASDIKTCLNRLLASRYRNLQVIVADNASSDGTKKIVRSQMATNKKIRLYAKRTRGEQRDVISRAYKAYATGGLVAVLDAQSSLDKQAIGLAVDYFNADPYLDILHLNKKCPPALQAAGLFQIFGLLLKNRSYKASAHFKANYFADYLGAVFYSSGYFSKQFLKKQLSSPLLQLGDKNVRQYYASNALVFVPALGLKELAILSCALQLNRLRILAKASPLLANKENPGYTALLIWIWLPLSIVFSVAALTLPIILMYFTYLALDLKQPNFLLVSCVAFSFLLAAIISEDNQMSVLQKVKHIGLLPVAYGWFCLLCVMQYVTLAAALLGRRAKRLGASAA